MIMVPSKEFKRLTDCYKGELIETVLLNKAARLAARKHALVRDKRIPPGIAVKRIKPIAKTNDLRQKEKPVPKPGAIKKKNPDIRN